MWLSKSSVGRKVVMSVTGLFLVLFVTFHAVMNAVGMIWPAAYNSICEFLGANWYALIGTAVIAAGCVLHILYAFWLTIQNRKARGNDPYEVSKRPKSVEWASQNMLVLGIIVVVFMGIHLYHFWAKMQLPEVMGEHLTSTGMGFIYNTFKAYWVAPVYIIGFIALGFHMTHGFWSAFQSLGTNNSVWLPRLKKAAAVWAIAVCALFTAEAVVFTVKANCKQCLYNEAHLLTVPAHEEVSECAHSHEACTMHVECDHAHDCVKDTCDHACEHNN